MGHVETSEATLAGVWGGALSLGPEVRGTLAIDARGRGERGRIAGFDVAVERVGGEVRLALPEGLGEFRGRGDGHLIRGHWIQPAGVAFAPRYATPMDLRPVAAGLWEGEVQPLEERLTLYASIRRASEGGWSATLRNPEFGALSRGVWRVETQPEDRVRFVTESGDYHFPARHDRAGDRLILSPEGLPAPIVLTRRSRRSAVGFYPSPPEPFAYQTPVACGDGWPVAAAGEVGMDAAALSALAESLRSADPHDERAFAIHSLLIARRGKLVFEAYFRGFDRERPHDARSAGKTWGPVLIGALRQRGVRIDAATPIAPLFGRYRPFAHDDARKDRLTLAHLMSMTAGLASDDGDGASPGGEDRMQSQTEQPDWWRYFLDLPVVGDPGGDVAVYSSASLNLVGGVAERVGGAWNVSLFDRLLARPLQFGRYHLNLMPTGSGYFGGGVHLKPRDALKLGQLYRDGGVWRGRRLIGRDWVAQSTSAHARFARPVIPTDRDHRYGYGWHVHRVAAGGRTLDLYAASGNGGQWVLVIPELDLVVGVNGGSYRNAGAWFRWGLEVLPEYLMAACR